jgi:hypothetical protein
MADVLRPRPGRNMCRSPGHMTLGDAERAAVKGNRLIGLVLTLAIAGCRTSSPSIEPTSRATPTPVPAAATEVALTPVNACHSDQIEATDMGIGEPGFVSVRVRQIGGDPCVIRLYPTSTIDDAGGITLVRSRPVPGPPEFYPVKGDLLFDLSWTVVCPRPTLLRPLTAWIAFAEPEAPLRVGLPDSYMPDCVLYSAGMAVGPGFSLDGGGSGGSGG